MLPHDADTILQDKSTQVSCSYFARGNHFINIDLLNVAGAISIQESDLHSAAGNEVMFCKQEPQKQEPPPWSHGASSQLSLGDADWTEVWSDDVRLWVSISHSYSPRKSKGLLLPPVCISSNLSSHLGLCIYSLHIGRCTRSFLQGVGQEKYPVGMSDGVSGIGGWLQCRWLHRWLHRWEALWEALWVARWVAPWIQ